MCLFTCSLSCFATFSRCVCHLLHGPSLLLISFFECFYLLYIYRLKMMHLHAIIRKNSSLRWSQPIITTDLICLKYELGVNRRLVACIHINNRVRDHLVTCTQGHYVIKAEAFNLFHVQCPFGTSKMYIFCAFSFTSDKLKIVHQVHVKKI